MTPRAHTFDIIALGAGTAGSGVVRYASKYGKSAAIIERTSGYGGTCVQVGCVPKKLMWIVSSALEATEGILGPKAAQALRAADGGMQGGFAWERIRELRDAEVARQKSIIKTNFAAEGITRIQGIARLVSATEVEITPTADDGTPAAGAAPYRISAPHVALTTGGSPIVPTENDVPGARHGIDSDGFFALEHQPKRVALVGAGYISVELSGIFNALGTDTHTLIRQDKVLRCFDDIVQDTVTEHMERSGIHVHKRTHVKEVVKKASGVLTLKLDSGATLEVDVLVWAIGRRPMTHDIGLEAVGVQTDAKGFVKTDAFENTSVEGVYAVGDCAGKRLLTPVALAAGRRLSGRLFGPPALKDLKLDYDFIPSVVFAHPPVGTVGLTEREARDKHGEDSIKVYTTAFGALPYKMMDRSAEEPTAYKVVCAGPDERVVGIHIVGAGSDEMLQGFAVAVKLGATMRDFLDTVAIHPTSAEELTTIRPPF